MLAQEQHRVGEGHRVDHDEPGGHEHRPSARERSTATGSGAPRAPAPDDQRGHADNHCAVGEQQHRRDHAAPPRAGARRERAEEQRRRHAQRDAQLVAVRDACSPRPTRCRGPTRAPRVTSGGDDRADDRDGRRRRRRSRRATASTTNAGAIDAQRGEAERAAARSWRAARRPTRPTAAPAAATRGASDQTRAPRAAAGPAVSGSVTHATRSSHRKGGRRQRDSVRSLCRS